MIKGGADYARHDGSEQSALDIIGRVVERSPVYLRIQEELHAGAEVSQTGAAQALISELLHTVKELQDSLDNVREKLAKTTDENAVLLTALSRSRQDVLDKIIKYETEIRKLNSDNDKLKNRITRIQAGFTWTFWDLTSAWRPSFWRS